MYRPLEMEKETAAATRFVFVLGTGRCGTSTLATLLSRCPGCSVRHEVDPPLLCEVTEYLRGRLAFSEVVRILRDTRTPESLGAAPLCGESNQRLSFLLPAVHEAFPEARYIWLMRDGRDVVASTVNRQWYAAEKGRQHAPGLPDWHAHRVTADVVGEMSADQWKRLSHFAKNCWYWAYTNRLIGEQVQRLQLPTMRVRLEELDEHLPRILQFLELGPGLRPAVPRENTARRRVFYPSAPLSWRYWTKRQVREFSELAGETMDELYAGWRAELTRRNATTAACYRALWKLYRRGYQAAATTTWPLRRRLGLTNQRVAAWLDFRF